MNAPSERNAIAVAVPQQRQTVLWIIAILLAIIATALVLRPEYGFAAPRAYGDSPMMGSRGLMAFTGQIDKYSYGLFMVDTDNSTVWCYQYVPGTRRMKLVAARSFMYDRYLEDFNIDEPTLEQARGMLAKQRKIEDRINGGGGDASALGNAAPLQSSGPSPDAIGLDD